MADENSGPGQARQPQPGRRRQVRRRMSKASLSAPDATSDESGKAAQIQQATVRQMRADKQARTALVGEEIVALPKVQFARSMQHRQISATKLLRASLPADIAARPIEKVAAARVAQVKQRAAKQSSRRQAT